MATPRKTLQKDPRRLGFTGVDSLVSELAAMHEAISKRAYEIFDNRGRSGEQDLDDWLEAEHELTWAPAIELSQEDDALRLEVALAGFEPDELDVRLTADEVLIRSDRVHDDAESADSLYCCEFGRGQLFRRVHLPQTVDPGKAQAQYRNGLLSITAPLADRPHSENVPVATL